MASNIWSECPYSNTTIQTVATELYLREMRAPPSLLSGDAAVLLDHLTDRGLNYLAPTEWLATNHNGSLWFNWLVRNTLEIINLRNRSSEVALWERNVTNQLCTVLSNWLVLKTITEYSKNNTLRMVAETSHLPSDLLYLFRIISGDTGVFYATSGWSTWRLHPLIARLHDPHAPVPER